MPESVFCIIPLQEAFNQHPKRLIFVHGDFFQNHLPFVLEVLTTQFRSKKCGKDGEALQQPIWTCVNPKRSGFGTGPSIVVQAQIIKRFVDRLTGQFPRTFEGHVLQKVTHPHQS